MLTPVQNTDMGVMHLCVRFADNVWVEDRWSENYLNVST